MTCFWLKTYECNTFDSFFFTKMVTTVQIAHDTVSLLEWKTPVLISQISGLQAAEIRAHFITNYVYKCMVKFTNWKSNNVAKLQQCVIHVLSGLQ